MKTSKSPKIIKNKKAHFLYQIIETYNAGIQLVGCDVKMIRSGKINLSESYCNFINNELYISSFHLAERNNDRLVVFKNKAQRKLLLNKRELNKLEQKQVEKGMSIVPLSMFFTESGWVKAEIALVKGKREFDKRQVIKASESKKELDRLKKVKSRYN